MILRSENMHVWNACGLVAANGGVAMALSVFEQALDAARQEGRDEFLAKSASNSDPRDERIAALEGVKPYVLRWELGQPGGRVVVEFETDVQMSAILAALTQPPKEA